MWLDLAGSLEWDGAEVLPLADFVSLGLDSSVQGSLAVVS